MRVLIINVVCGIKSTGRICTDIAKELETRGHEVKVAYGRQDVPEQFKKYAVRIGTETDIRMHGIKSRLFDACGFGSKNATKKFIDWVKEYEPDVIHLHNLHGYYINVEILFNYLRTCGKKIIWTFHDCWAFTGHSALCDGDKCEKWEYGCGDCPQTKIYPGSFVDRSKKNWIKKKKIFSGIPNMEIIVPSHWLSDCVSRSFMKDYHICTINNGIDTNTMKPSNESGFRNRYNLNNKFIILGVASAWGRKKGFEDYISISNILDNTYLVVLVGVNKKMQTTKYQNLLTLGRTENMIELAEIYSSADVFVNLTYCDTFPTVNLEARACGLPIITYRTGGCIEAAGEALYDSAEKGDINGIVNCIRNFRIQKEEGKIFPFFINKENLDLKEFLKRYISKVEGNEST